MQNEHIIKALQERVKELEALKLPAVEEVEWIKAVNKALLDGHDSVCRRLKIADQFLERLSQWDVLNMPPGSGDDGPYWQGEIARVRKLLIGFDDLSQVDKSR